MVGSVRMLEAVDVEECKGDLGGWESLRVDTGLNLALDVAVLETLERNLVDRNLGADFELALVEQRLHVATDGHIHVARGVGVLVEGNLDAIALDGVVVNLLVASSGIPLDEELHLHCSTAAHEARLLHGVCRVVEFVALNRDGLYLFGYQQVCLALLGVGAIDLIGLCDYGDTFTLEVCKFSVCHFCLCLLYAIGPSALVCYWINSVGRSEGSYESHCLAKHRRT